MGLVAVWVMRFEEGDIIRVHKTMETAGLVHQIPEITQSNWRTHTSRMLSKLPFPSAPQFLACDSHYNNNNNNNFLNEIMKIKSSCVWKCTDSNWHKVFKKE